MGRKRKAMHNKRHPCTVSLPVDIHLHLDTIKDSGLTISRYLEQLIRKEIEKGQTTLNGYLYGCKECEAQYHSKAVLKSNYCRKCQNFDVLFIMRNLDLNPIKEEEE